jgi:hypothetical protein
LDDQPTKRYLASYFWDDAWWSVIVTAYDWQDAEARCKALGRLRLDGELVVTIPMPVSSRFALPFIRFFNWLLGR